MLNYFIVLLAVCLGLNNVNTTSQFSMAEKIQAVEIRDNDPLFGERFYRVYYAAPFVVYQSQHMFGSSQGQVKFDSSTNKPEVELTTETTEQRNRFFVFHRDSNYGFQYDAYATSQAERRLVDSVLKNIRGGNNLESLLCLKADTITWNEGKTELKEVYVQKASEDTPAVRIV